MWLYAGLFGAGLFGAKRGICAADKSSTPFVGMCKLSMSSVPGATASMMGVVASTGDGTGEATSRAPTVSTPQEANHERGSI